MITTLILFICWIPTLLARYPGAFSTDNFEQLIQHYSGTYYNAHPILHSVYLINVVLLGNFLFGSHTHGIALYSILQMLYTALAISYTIKVFADMKMNKIFSIVIMIFAMFYPPIAHHTMIAHKDILCTIVIINLILQLVKIAQDYSGYFSKKRNIFKFALWVTLPLFLRHNIFYAYLIALPLILLIMAFNIKGKEKFKYILIVFSIFAVSMVFYTKTIDFVMKKYNIAPGSKREFYSIPAQMLGRLATFKKDDLTDEEKEWLLLWFKSEFKSENIQKFDDISKFYLPKLADPLKNRISIDIVENEECKKKAISNFIKLFKKYPQEMIMGALVHTNLYYYPYMPAHMPQIQVSNAHHPHQEEAAQKINAKLDRKIDKAGRIENYTNYIYLAKIPVLSIFVNIGYTVYVVIISMMYIIYRKKYIKLIIFMPLLGVYATCLLSPVGGEIRYFLPMYIGVLIGLPFATENKDGKYVE